jgi:hypothetical protein
MDDGFHRTPLVHGRLKALQYVFPRAVGAAQYLLSNEPNSFGCAAQYDRWARADTQLRIDWKVRHGQLTPGCGRGSIRRGNEIVRGNSFRAAQSARKLLLFSSSEGSVLIFILLRRVGHVRVFSLLVERHLDNTFWCVHLQGAIVLWG